MALSQGNVAAECFAFILEPYGALDFPQLSSKQLNGIGLHPALQYSCMIQLLDYAIELSTSILQASLDGGVKETRAIP